MLRSSMPAGRMMGVEVRVHLSFAVLLVLAAGYSAFAMGNALRGLGFWLALCFAVAVREAARGLSATFLGLRLRGVLLLPIGGVMAFAPARNGARPSTRFVTFAGPLANFAMGALMLGLCYAYQPGLHLFTAPWIGVTHMLRTFIWMQVVLGVIGFLPSGLPVKARPERKPATEPTDAAQPAAEESTRLKGLTAALNFSSAMAVALVLAGMLLLNPWLVVIGAFWLLKSMMNNSTNQALSAPGAETIRVRDVMLTEYTLLSTSDTLLSALDRTAHSLQEVFPVVRGDRLVGSVARDTLLASLQLQGEAYLQGVMTRTLQSTGPDEKLVDALRRSAALGASELIPVVEEGALLGILTPQSLSRSVQVVRRSNLP